MEHLNAINGLVIFRNFDFPFYGRTFFDTRPKSLMQLKNANCRNENYHSNYYSVY